MTPSTARAFRPAALLIAGLAAMLIGAIDPLEGSVLILAGTLLAALGAYFGRSQYRALLYWAFGLTAAGVGALFGWSAVGGVGGRSGHSGWWGLSMLPYPAGWIMGLAGAVMSLRERRRGHV